jgi:hypothetical protein
MLLITYSIKLLVIQTIRTRFIVEVNSQLNATQLARYRVSKEDPQFWTYAVCVDPVSYKKKGQLTFLGSAADLKLLSLTGMDCTSSQIWPININICFVGSMKLRGKLDDYAGWFVIEFIMLSITYFLFTKTIRIHR